MGLDFRLRVEIAKFTRVSLRIHFTLSDTVTVGSAANNLL